MAIIWANNCGGSQHPLKQQSSDIKTRTYTAYLHNFLCDYFKTTTVDDTRCFLSFIFSIAQRLKHKIWITIDDKNSFEHVKLFTIYGCIVLWPRNKSHKPNENDPMCISSENVILFRFVHPLHWFYRHLCVFILVDILCASC